MATLRDIKQRIGAVKSTSKITQAMKMVAAAQLRRAQNRIESARPYFSKLEEMMSNLIGAVGEDYSHELIRNPEEIKNIALITISSDRGLCGNFNTNLLKESIAYINNQIKNEHPDANIHIVSVGKKAVGFYRKQKIEIIDEFKDVFTNLQFPTAKNIINAVKGGFISGKYDKVIVFYNEFVNILKQTPSIKQILPILPAEKAEEDSHFNVDYIFEPNKHEILDELLPKLVDIQVWRGMLESNAAEQAARMMAMDNATNNARDLIQELELQYNKARQAAITTEMLEIVGGANALKKG